MKQHEYDGTTPTLIGWFDDFEGEHAFTALSNFYEGEPLTIPHVSKKPFATGEHAYAAMKTLDADIFELVRTADSPGEAKYLGQNLRLRPDWEEVKYDAMLAVLRSKFTLDREEGRVLLSTRDALLIEGTHWKDQVWGVDLRDYSAPANHAPGRNWLGTLLMARRAELRAEQVYGKVAPTVHFNAIFVGRSR